MLSNSAVVALREVDRCCAGLGAKATAEATRDARMAIFMVDLVYYTEKRHKEPVLTMDLRPCSNRCSRGCCLDHRVCATKIARDQIFKRDLL